MPNEHAIWFKIYYFLIAIPLKFFFLYVMCLILRCFQTSLFFFRFFCLVSPMCLLILSSKFFVYILLPFPRKWSNHSWDKSNSFFCDFCKCSRGIRPDVSLVPPIRQTASIFKQPVTVHRNHDSKVKTDLKHGTSQEKPKQLFWEKRLEVNTLQKLEPRLEF